MKKTGLGLLLALALAACTSPSGIRTTGSLRIQGVQPNVVAGCVVRAGDWMALKGNTFGTQEDWDSGQNYVLFPPDLLASAELTRESDPATLFFQVPQGATSGTLQVHVEGVGDAEIPIQVMASAYTPQMAVPVCEAPTPPE